MEWTHEYRVHSHVPHLHYATYGQGFQTNDLNTVARLFRDSQRQQDSFLATFTPAMLDTAERFREEECLARQQERAARSSSGPR